MLLNINERKRWVNPPPAEGANPTPADVKKREAQDEEIFQTARLVKYVAAPTIPSLPIV